MVIALKLARRGAFHALWLALLLVPATGASAATRYVALGDSFASGLGLAPLVSGAPTGCGRSTPSYPYLTYANYGFDSFADVTCSGAVINNMYVQQSAGGINPRQLDSLNGSETIVTLTIGVNDAGSGVDDDCLHNANLATTPCMNKYFVGGLNTLIPKAQAIGGPLASAINSIHTESPLAKVYVVGYEQLVPAGAIGCSGAVAVAPSDATLVDGWQSTINSTMSSTALANGALFVDNYTPSIGHSSCAGVGTRWVEPIINPQTSAPLHPNTTGQQMAFAHLKAAIDASGAGLPNDPATSDPAAGITSLALSKRSFRAAAGKQSRIAGIGAVLRLKLKAAGSVTITYSRKLPGVKRNGVCRATRSRSVSSTKRCTALRRVAGHLHLSGHSGVNVVRLSGRMKGRALAPGNYRLQVAVKWTSRSTSSSDSISFRILPN